MVRPSSVTNTIIIKYYYLLQSYLTRRIAYDNNINITPIEKYRTCPTAAGQAAAVPPVVRTGIAATGWFRFRVGRGKWFRGGRGSSHALYRSHIHLQRDHRIPGVQPTGRACGTRSTVLCTSLIRLGGDVGALSRTGTTVAVYASI